MWGESRVLKIPMGEGQTSDPKKNKNSYGKPTMYR